MQLMASVTGCSFRNVFVTSIKQFTKKETAANYKEEAKKLIETWGARHHALLPEEYEA